MKHMISATGSHVIEVVWGKETFFVTVNTDGVEVAPAAPDGTVDLLAGRQVWVDPFQMNHPDDYADQRLLVHAYHDDSDSPVTLRLATDSIALSSDGGGTMKDERNNL